MRFVPEIVHPSQALGPALGAALHVQRYRERGLYAANNAELQARCSLVSNNNSCKTVTAEYFCKETERESHIIVQVLHSQGIDVGDGSAAFP